MAEIDLDQRFDVNEFFGEHFPELPEEARGLIKEILNLRNEIRERVRILMEKPIPFFVPAIGATEISQILRELEVLDAGDFKQKIVLDDESMRFSTSTKSNNFFHTNDRENIFIQPNGVSVETREGRFFPFGKEKRAVTETFSLQDPRLVTLLRSFRERLRRVLLAVERFESQLCVMAS